MANVNPYKEEIIERMKELIREGKPRDYVVDTIKEEFKGLVHKNTPYEWWKDIITTRYSRMGKEIRKKL